MSRAWEWVWTIIDPTPVLATVFMICMGYELHRYPVVFPTAPKIEEEMRNDLH